VILKWQRKRRRRSNW